MRSSQSRCSGFIRTERRQRTVSVAEACQVVLAR